MTRALPAGSFFFTGVATAPLIVLGTYYVGEQVVELLKLLKDFLCGIVAYPTLSRQPKSTLTGCLSVLARRPVAEQLKLLFGPE